MKLLSNPVIWGTIATLIVCISALTLGGGEVCSDTNTCLSRKDVFLNSSPNEIGDTLAGFAGTLAFVWIIVTVLLQSKELAAQREELRLTRSEMKAQREASQDMARAMSAQARVFVDEQRQRDEGRAETLLNEMLSSLVFAFSESRERGVFWQFSNAPIDDEFGTEGELHIKAIGNRSDEELAIDEAIVTLRRRLSVFYQDLWDWLHSSLDYRVPDKSEVILGLLSSIQRITELQGELSLPQQERLHRLRLSEISSALNELLEQPAFWKEVAE